MRLENRGTETPSSLSMRLKNAEKEIDFGTTEVNAPRDNVCFNVPLKLKAYELFTQKELSVTNTYNLKSMVSKYCKCWAIQITCLHCHARVVVSPSMKIQCRYSG